MKGPFTDLRGRRRVPHADFADTLAGWAKAALEAWNTDLARYLGPRRITANIVAPGLVVDTGFFHGKLTGERREQLIGATMTGQAGRPEDVAAVVRFLAAPEAGHITGQVVHVNGGAYSG